MNGVRDRHELPELPGGRALPETGYFNQFPLQGCGCHGWNLLASQNGMHSPDIRPGDILVFRAGNYGRTGHNKAAVLRTGRQGRTSKHIGRKRFHVLGGSSYRIDSEDHCDKAYTYIGVMRYSHQLVTHGVARDDHRIL